MGGVKVSASETDSGKTQLAAPTGLAWTDNFDVQFNAVEGSTGLYTLEVTKDGESYETISWSGLTGKEVVEISFSPYITESGTYQFRIKARAASDDEVYTGSDWSEWSAEKVYVRPDTALGTTTGYWDTETTGKFYYTSVENAGGYWLRLYKEQEDGSYVLIYGTRWVSETRRDTADETLSYDYFSYRISTYGEGRYYETVQALSGDVTTCANGEEGEPSAVLDTTSGSTGAETADTEQIEEFVTRLYQVCLNRDPDDAGLADWVNRLATGQETGASAAYGFIFSTEFQNYNFCNTDYVKQLYRAFMGREYDDAGLADWVSRLETGTTREEVFNGFSQSTEFQNICNTYGITLGDPIEIPQYGTVPHGSCSVCGETDGVTAFVTRLYSICLDREPDEAGLADWTGQLWDHTKSGRDVSYGFIFSQEFTNKNLSDESFVEYLY
ncbi:MAG: DUF4214 domain-containing protein, partial [Lachnospiraceae bacterium]|nr:DUF4214 domain-containing protein [Lachnospiraceae bacterium]